MSVQKIEKFPTLKIGSIGTDTYSVMLDDIELASICKSLTLDIKAAERVEVTLTLTAERVDVDIPEVAAALKRAGVNPEQVDDVLASSDEDVNA